MALENARLKAENGALHETIRRLDGHVTDLRGQVQLLTHQHYTAPAPAKEESLWPDVLRVLPVLGLFVVIVIGLMAALWWLLPYLRFAG